MIKRIISAAAALITSGCFSLTALGADNNVFPDDPAGRWQVFKNTYQPMPTGFKVSLALIALLIIASVVYYKLSGGKGADKPIEAPPIEEPTAEEPADDNKMSGKGDESDAK